MAGTYGGIDPQEKRYQTVRFISENLPQHVSDIKACDERVCGSGNEGASVCFTGNDL
jgi:hypothetical protein